ncbi:MAG: hypothetical protein AB1Z57_00455 [Acidimicrobiia bacterium]
MRRVVVWTVLLATFALLALQLVRAPAFDPLGGASGLAIAMIPMAIVGGVLSLRVPGNAVGPLTLGAAVGGSLAGMSDVMHANAYVAAGLPAHPDPGVDQATVDAFLSFEPDTVWTAVHIVGNVGGLSAAFLLLGILPILFPTGAPRRSWRWAVPALSGLLALSIGVQVFGSPLTDACVVTGPEVVVPAGALIDPDDECIVQVANPLAVPGVPGSNSAVGGAVVGISLMIAMSVGVAAFAARYRAADRGVRQQMRWLMATLGLFVATFVPTTLLIEAAGLAIPSWVTSLGFLFGLTLIPISIGIAVLRYRLYDLGRLLSRTITYALLIGLIATGYAIGAVWLPTRLGFTDDPIWIATTTLLLALAFNPVRRRLTRWLDRRFNRTPYDPESVVDELTESLRSTTDPEQVLDHWSRAIHDTLQPSSLSVWMGTFRP